MKRPRTRMPFDVQQRLTHDEMDLGCSAIGREVVKDVDGIDAVIDLHVDPGAARHSVGQFPHRSRVEGATVPIGP